MQHLHQRLQAGQAANDLGDLTTLDKYPRIGLPFATYGADAQVEAYLFSQRKVAPEYYVGAVGVCDEAELARKLAVVSRQEYLLVHRGWESAWARDPCRAQVQSIKKWFLYPADLPCRQAPLDRDAAINQLIAREYQPAEDVGPHIVLRRIRPAGRNRRRVPKSGTPSGLE